MVKTPPLFLVSVLFLAVLQGGGPALAYERQGCLLNLSTATVTGKVRGVDSGYLGGFVAGPNSSWCHDLDPGEYEMVFTFGELVTTRRFTVNRSRPVKTDYRLRNSGRPGQDRDLYWFVVFER